ncbi:MAG: hypothetical protein JW735_10455 [Prolixibacteraceae bacterium]|jgi:hypothetical protein|nr:hypothetical protein [Prolixibacteraceae bacterium]
MKGKTEKNEYFNLIYQYLDGQLNGAQKNDFDNLLANDSFLSEAIDAYRKTPRKLAYKNIEAIDYVNGRIRKKVPFYALVMLIVALLIIAVFIVWSVISDASQIKQTNHSPKNINSKVVPDTLLFDHVLNTYDILDDDSSDSIFYGDTLDNDIDDDEKVMETVIDQPKKPKVVVKKKTTEKRIVYEPVEPMVPISTDVLPDISQKKDSAMLKPLN